VSHLRFGPEPIRSTYLIRKAEFVACHRFDLLNQVGVLDYAKPGGIFLLNSPGDPHEAWDLLPREVQEQIILKNLDFYAIDASSVARGVGMPGRINTIMQTCYFAISGVLPRDEAIAQIKSAIKKTYGKRGEAVVQRNFEAVDASVANMHEVQVPDKVTSTFKRLPPVWGDVPDFVQRVTGMIIAGQGDLLPVSALPVDGTFPTGTARWEKRGIAREIPIWDPKICIDCALCSLVCPHAAIRMKPYEPAALEGAPEGFLSKKWSGKELANHRMTIQVAPDDCTGCGVCVDVCPAKSKEVAKHKAINMEPKDPHLERERERFDFFLTIPEVDRALVNPSSLKGSQALLPLFEFSSACAGCGETYTVDLLAPTPEGLACLPFRHDATRGTSIPLVRTDAAALRERPARRGSVLADLFAAEGLAAMIDILF